VRVATGLFHRAGVQAVSVEAILQAAEVSRPTLYRYFESKDELVLACIDEEAAQTFRALDAAMSAAGPEPAAQVLAAARLLTGEAGGTEGGLLALDVAGEFLDEAHPVRQAAARAAQQISARLTRPLKASMDGGAEQIAAHLVLLLLGVRVAAQVIGRQAATQTLIASVEGLLASSVAIQNPDTVWREPRSARPSRSWRSSPVNA
jgi:AcrR family transcriptional regulator